MIDIEPYDASDRAEALEIAIRAWHPVCAQLKQAVPGFVYDNFYPDGWEARQGSDLGTVLDEAQDKVAVARRNDKLVGWISIRKTRWGRSTSYASTLSINDMASGER